MLTDRDVFPTPLQRQTVGSLDVELLSMLRREAWRDPEGRRFVVYDVTKWARQLHCWPEQHRQTAAESEAPREQFVKERLAHLLRLGVITRTQRTVNGEVVKGLVILARAEPHEQTLSDFEFLKSAGVSWNEPETVGQ